MMLEAGAARQLTKLAEPAAPAPETITGAITTMINGLTLKTSPGHTRIDIPVEFGMMFELRLILESGAAESGGEQLGMYYHVSS